MVTRGNNKRRIYEDDLDRALFCRTVDRASTKFEWRVLAFVLMRNHYHLLLSIGDAGLAAGMQYVNFAYARTYNIRHERINHLFGKRYWSKQLTTEAAVRNAARYIVQNPWRAGSPLPLEVHRWSSYSATVGLSFPEITLALDELLPFFGSSPAKSVQTYRDFCAVMADPDELEEPCPVPGTVT
ncbi:MAG TPA: transposase [Gaiellaceae bacterium]